MEVEINAPWGSTTLDTEKPLSVIKYGLKQLEYYRDFNFNTTQSLKEDIEGYKIICESRNPKLNSAIFLREKNKRKMKSPNNKTGNIEIIRYLKKEDLWEN